MDLNYVFDNVPHMKKLWPQGYQVEVDFLPAVIKAPAYLEHAFPERQPEARPSTVYYSMEGERKERIASSHSSHGAGTDFELPAEDRKGPDLPNPIYGMATSEPYGFGESISQARKPQPSKGPAKPMDETLLHTFRGSITMILDPALLGHKVRDLRIHFRLAKTLVFPVGTIDQLAKEAQEEKGETLLAMGMKKMDLAIVVETIADAIPHVNVLDEVRHLLVTIPQALPDLPGALDVEETGMVVEMVATVMVEVATAEVEVDVTG
ncbi:hypothetical protein B0H13DRAFT_2385470 [Mycena leptocephala]|nr:hypothetical protein B0H13DRAFT_2385470 [Mycena leptocephala]